MTGTATSTINERIATLLNTSNESSPQALAPLLIATMTESERAAAFDDVAPSVISWYISRNRIRLTQVPVTKPQSTSMHPVETMPQRINAWARKLRERHLGADAWKMLKDFTIADCQHAAAANRQQAAMNEAAARRWEMRATALQEAGVATLSQLDEETLQRVLV